MTSPRMPCFSRTRRARMTHSAIVSASLRQGTITDTRGGAPAATVARVAAGVRSAVLMGGGRTLLPRSNMERARRVEVARFEPWHGIATVRICLVYDCLYPY